MPQDQITPSAERETSRFLPAYSLHLDLIRGLAALVVFYGHLHLVVTGHGSIGSDSHSLAVATHPADGLALPHAAVVIFFVLSGYLVGGSVVRDLGRERFSWRSYATRRLTRLWTVLIPALALGAILDGLNQWLFSATPFFRSDYFTSQLHGWPTPLNFARYLFFLQTIDWIPAPRFGTNGALWSLSSELWYYALFPLLAICVFSARMRKTIRVGCALLLAVLLVAVGSRITFSFPVWLLGVVAYCVPARIPAGWQVRANLALAIQFFAALYVLRAKPMNPALADGILSLSFTLLLYGLLHRGVPVGNTLYSRTARAVSLPSYTLYACHIPMTVFLACWLASTAPGAFHHTALAMGSIFIAVLIYVRVVYELFERNTDRIRRSVEGRLFRPRAELIPDSARIASPEIASQGGS